MSYEDIFRKSHAPEQTRTARIKDSVDEPPRPGRPRGSSLLGPTEQCQIRLPVGMIQRLDEAVVHLRALYPEQRGQIRRNAVVAAALGAALDDQDTLAKQLEDMFED